MCACIITPRRAARADREASEESVPVTRDHTLYGDSTASPSSFYRHHLAAHSSAVVFTDADTVLDDASTKAFWLARGFPNLAWSATTGSREAT